MPPRSPSKRVADRAFCRRWDASSWRKPPPNSALPLATRNTSFPTPSQDVRLSHPQRCLARTPGGAGRRDRETGVGAVWMKSATYHVGFKMGLQGPTFFVLLGYQKDFKGLHVNDVFTQATYFPLHRSLHHSLLSDTSLFHSSTFPARFLKTPESEIPPRGLCSDICE